MAKQFTSAEWNLVREKLEAAPGRYGLPQREYGSVLLGSFNIRKLGSSRSRSTDTWKFLADICRSFDLVAVQEIMGDLGGLRRLMSLLGPDFSLVVSDQTGVFPGEPGVGERLGFIYRWKVVERMEVASDVTYDRSKVIDSIADNYEAFVSDMEPYARRLADYEAGRRKTRPRLRLRVFLSFIRQPFCVAFRIAGHPGTQPYEFMAINAHLYFGNYINPASGVQCPCRLDHEPVEGQHPFLLPQLHPDGRSQPGLRQPSDRSGSNRAAHQVTE